MSKALRVSQQLISSWDIQCAVTAKYELRLALDQELAVMLILPQECFEKN